ncbi:MAG: hypothetical protein FJ211_08910 [Ignavibacteria bacterium]|nr:hypothetical protein [Ignavibacteria bacterium]
MTRIASLVVSLIALVAIASADVQQLCKQFDNQIEALDVKGAKASIDAALEEDGKSHDVLYRQARLHNILGDQESQDEKKLAMYNKAYDFANKAIANNSQSMGGYVYRAAANGKIALFKGIFSVASVVNAVRADATKAIQLNNETSERLAAACYILGRAHLNLVKKPKLFRLPLGLGWGNVEEASTYLKRARQLRPNFVMFELEYARCLAEMDMEKDAIGVAQKISSLANKEPGDQQRKQEAQQLIKDLQ